MDYRGSSVARERGKICSTEVNWARQNITSVTIGTHTSCKKVGIPNKLADTGICIGGGTASEVDTGQGSGGAQGLVV